MDELDKAKPDQRLVGIWEPSESKSGKEFWFIGKAIPKGAPAGLMVVCAVSLNENGTVRADTVYFFPSQIERSSFANVLQPEEEISQFKAWKKTAPKSYLFLKYAVERDRLSIWVMNRKVIREAIERRQLKGTIKKGKGLFPIDQVMITEGTTALRKLMGERHDLFDQEALVLQKVSK